MNPGSDKLGSNQRGSDSRPSSARPQALVFGLAVLAIGLLFWARFIIVTNHPRTAIAEPAAAASVPAADPPRAASPDAP